MFVLDEGATQINIVVVALFIVGIVGTIVPVLPGPTIVVLGVVLWAGVVGSPAGWVVAGFAILLAIIAGVLKYVIAGRSMKRSGVPNRSIIFGGIGAIVGYFVIPLVGLIVGFLFGVFATERVRLKENQAAWSSTWVATKAVGFGIMLELFAELLTVTLWIAAAIFPGFAVS